MNATPKPRRCGACGFEFKPESPADGAADCPRCNAPSMFDALISKLEQPKAPGGDRWPARLTAAVGGAVAGALAGPLILAIFGAISCGIQRGIPMVSIPNPIEAACAGFIFVFVLMGVPAACVGACIGAIAGFVMGGNGK